MVSYVRVHYISFPFSSLQSEDYADAHYLSANCVVLTYFSDPCPMSQRNLPASFWNSQYQVSYPSAGSHLGHDALYSDYSSFHGLPQPDPWAYNLTAAQQYSHHHRSVSDFTYMPSSSRDTEFSSRLKKHLIS
ncbi:hypothetical protein Anas_07887 [Armadillidium nasatum]|uniref:Uncharacterized protein n=1 Tax=Armadillidium nasatum TaxID=96803 RepID=A0A5N5SPF7_9CRUS|nr:hypothetical protein Anas_07887 [Armadillidium nasatum]